MALSSCALNGSLFVMDSCASRHMVHVSEILSNVKRRPKHEVLTASGQSLDGELYGDLNLIVTNLDDVESQLTIPNVLCEVIFCFFDSNDFFSF